MERPWYKHVAEGNPREIDIPDITLLELFKQSAHKYANHTAITFQQKTYTYKQLDQMIDSAAGSLYNLGVKKGVRVALMLPNCPQYPIAYYAALACGATIVQINPLYKSSELMHVLNDSEATVMIVLEQMLATVEEIQGETLLNEVISVSFESGSKFDELIQERGLKAPAVSINPREDIAVLQYTGGTTGRAKGAMLTHYNLVSNTLQSYATAVSRTVLGEERVLSISPLFHVYGMTSCMNLTFYIGGNLILIPRFQPEEVVNIIEQTKPSIFPGVPTMYIALLNYFKVRPFNLSCLKTCSSGSAPLPAEVLKQFNETSGTKVAEGFGLSEASPVTHRNPINGLQKAGSIGIPIPNTDARIVDAATGTAEMTVGEVGELIVKGPQVMKGYWNLPEETEHALRNGWLYTGDLAKMDSDGYFYIIGRKKELIIASGYNVYPIEVEDILYAHPKVLEAAVVGVPDPYRGETVKAFVVLKENEQLSEEELIQYCRDQLAVYKVPHAVEFLQEFPKTAVGKILKRSLKEQFQI